MRDALSLLDQILSACGPSPSDEAVAEALGAIDRTVVQQMTEGLIRRDAARVLGHVAEVYNRGLDLKRLAEEISLQLRHLFVTKTTGEAPAELAESERRALVELSREADAAQIARMFDIVHAYVMEVTRADQPKLALEMSLLKAIQLAPAASIPELVAKIERLSGGSLAADPKRAPAPAGAPGGRSAPPPFRS